MRISRRPEYVPMTSSAPSSQNLPSSKPKATINPFALNKAGARHLIERIVDLMPSSPDQNAAARAERERQQAEAQARWQEARHGALPPDTYRLLEQGSLMGWYVELELQGRCLVLRDSTQKVPFNSEFSLFGRPARTMDVARKHIAAALGPAAARRAKFRRMFGGQL
jgi:hypothetical protein